MLISQWHSLPRQRTVEIDICQHCLRLSFQVNSWQGHSPPGWWQHAEKMRNYAEAGLTRLLLGPRHHLCSFSATCNKTCKLNCEWIAACSMQKYAGRTYFGWTTHAVWTCGGALGPLHTFHVVLGSNTPLTSHHGLRWCQRPVPPNEFCSILSTNVDLQMSNCLQHLQLQLLFLSELFGKR